MQRFVIEALRLVNIPMCLKAPAETVTEGLKKLVIVGGIEIKIPAHQ